MRFYHRMLTSLVLVGGFLLAIAVFAHTRSTTPIQAETSTHVELEPGMDPKPTLMNRVTAHAEGRGNPRINLRDGVELPTTYTGPAGLQQVLQQKLAQPLALAAGDFDEDGVPDLISGYAGPYGGLITLHRGNVDSIFPNAPEARKRMGEWGNGGMGEKTISDSPALPSSHPPFLSDARVIEVGEAPDFLGAGDFDADGHEDVVTAARSSHHLQFLRGDGTGALQLARAIELPGAVTAMITGEFNRRDGLDDVIVGIVGADGPQVLVFESPNGVLVGQPSPSADTHRERQTGRSAPLLPKALSMPAEVTALALGRLDDSSGIDLAVAAGTELILVSGRDRRLLLSEAQQATGRPAAMDQRSFPFVIRSLALGNFVADPESRTDIALLADNGSVHLLTNPHRSVVGDVGASGSGRPRLASVAAGAHRGAPLQRFIAGALSISPHLPSWAEIGGAPAGSPARGISEPSLSLAGWSSKNLGMISRSPATELVRAKVSSLPTDDLIAIGSSDHRLHILTTDDELQTMNHRRLATSDQRPTTMSVDSVPVAVLPLRLNRDALNDLVILKKDASTPVVALSAPLATFTVDSIGDGGDIMPGDGVCDDGTSGCTLRAALEEANALPGPDVIEFSIPGAGPHTIKPMMALPEIVDPVTIDGTTEPDFAGTPVIELDGSMAGAASGLGFGMGSGGSVVRGLAINRFGGGFGIATAVSGGNIIEGNFIGTDVTGTAGLSNGAGILILSDDNMVGGPTVGARNVISGNDSFGIELFGFLGSADKNLIQGNLIGTAVDGLSPLGNTIHGILQIGGEDNLIGGTSRSEGNTIAFNGGSGVVLTLDAGNTIQSNSIFANAGLGINLGPDGVTPNDPGDGDVGPNDFQNFPVLTLVASGDATTIAGMLDSAPLTAFTLQFFSNTACDPSGNGEGEIFLGSAVATTDATGMASFRVSLTGPILAFFGQFITATATDPIGNTSEFSACLQITNESPVARCRNLTVSAGADCRGAVRPEDVDNGSFDPEGDPLTLDLTPPGPYPFGITIATLTVTDGESASDSCTATVRVVDTTPPAIVCPADVTLLAGADGTASFDQQATALDNCDRTVRITSTPPLPRAFTPGIHTVTYTATDRAGNRSSCTTQITVIDSFRITGIFPTDGAANVPLVTNVEVQFNAPLVTESVNAQTLMVMRPNGTPISGAVSSIGASAFFFPERSLPPSASLQVLVVGGPNGVLGNLNGQIVPLNDQATKLVRGFSTESEAMQLEPPTDGGNPVRAEIGGTVVDDQGTGTAVTVPGFALKSDTVVKIIVLDSPERLAEVNNLCDVPLDALPDHLRVPGLNRASPVVRYESSPCGALAFSPAMDLLFPLQPNFRGVFPPGSLLAVFQLVQTETGLRFLATGIQAEVTESSEFALAAGVEVFGTFALFTPTPPELVWNRERREPLRNRSIPTPHPLGALPVQGETGGATLYFPVIDGGVGRETRLSLANRDGSQDRVVTLTAYNDDGSIHDRRGVRLTANQQSSLLVSSLFRELRSGTVMAQADGLVTGFYEIADNFIAPQMLDGAEAIVTPVSTMIFPLTQVGSGSSTEIHLFNPHETAVQVRFSAFRFDAGRVVLSKTQELLILQPHERIVSSSAKLAPSFPFSQFNGGYLLAETVFGGSIVGAQVIEEAVSGQRNLAILNGVGVPFGCLSNGAGNCQPDPLIPSASRQHSVYAIHLEPDPVEKELVLMNVSGQDAPVALSAFDTNGQFLGSRPARGFMRLASHQVLRLSIRQLFGIDLAQLGGVIRVEDPLSAVVGAIVNRDAANGQFMTAYPLIPDLAQDGRERTEAALSRIQIDTGSVGFDTGLFVLNPNNNVVGFNVRLIDPLGSSAEAPAQRILPRGTFNRAQSSLRVLFEGARGGYLEIQAEADARPGTGERLIVYGVYRGQRFLSAVPPQP